MGSEMCIRDSLDVVADRAPSVRVLEPAATLVLGTPGQRQWSLRFEACLLYTSDAADDPLRVDLGGRRINKKKKKIIFFFQAEDGIRFFFQAEDGIRVAQESRGLGDVYKRQPGCGR